MATAIIGTGNIGGTLARHLVGGGEPVVLAAKDEANAATLADELGELARAASVEEAITDADTVVFAVWLDTAKELLAKDAALLQDKVVVGSVESTRLRRERADDPDTPRRTVERIRDRSSPPRRRALRQGIRHSRRRGARECGQPGA